jgi:hypothetical protein
MGRGKAKKTLALIDACCAILQEIQPASVRATCYQLFIRKLIKSMEKTNTDKISKLLVDARKDGIVPWEWLVDETRDAERQGTWANPETFIPAVMRSYRRDRWELQSERVEVWSEKGTVRGTLAPVLYEFGVTFRVMHGYTSWTCLYKIAAECEENLKPLTVFYIGDYDPSGMQMSEVDLPGRLAELHADLTIQRLAIDKDFALWKQLPFFAAHEKEDDSRFEWFVSRYGTTCWELDAMSPPDLRAVVSIAIRSKIDATAWDRCEAVEAAEQRSLRAILGTWHSVVAGRPMT